LVDDDGLKVTATPLHKMTQGWTNFLYLICPNIYGF